MNKKNDVYIYFSPATDITGTNLMTKLEISGGKVKPPVGKKLIIGWGTKADDAMTFPKDTKILNHPNAIKTNRNKLEAINLMATALNVNGATHVAAVATTDRVKTALANGAMVLPLIGRKKYHQGGKGFWSCPTSAQLDSAITDGADYFQTMIPVKDEFRLHVFGDKVIHAVKKVKRTEEEFAAAFIEDELARQKSLAEKNNDPFDEATAKLMLGRQAKNAAQGGANMLVRSNRMGWKFAIVTKYDKALTDVAVKAVKALGLDFGAVDCCTDTSGNVFVFEVNSGPGLEATSFDKYIEAFEKVISDLEDKPKEVKSEKKTTVTAPITKEKVTGTLKTEQIGEKDFMKMQLSRLSEMLDEASDDELSTIKKLGAKLIFGGL